MSRPREDVLQFIGASFRSIWALELVLALRRERRAWTQAELIETLRASDLVVSKALEALVSAGLASIDRGNVTYQPVNRDAGECMDQVEELYRSRPNMVRRAIVSASTSSAVAFADAFKFRKGTDD